MLQHVLRRVPQRVDEESGTTDVEKPQTLSFEELPAWAKWARPDVSNHVPLKLGEDIEIRHLWGMDCYTRAAVLAAVSQAEGYQGPENIKKREKFLTKKLMPKVHADEPLPTFMLAPALGAELL